LRNVTLDNVKMEPVIAKMCLKMQIIFRTPRVSCMKQWKVTCDLLILLSCSTGGTVRDHS